MSLKAVNDEHRFDETGTLQAPLKSNQFPNAVSLIQQNGIVWNPCKSCLEVFGQVVDMTDLDRVVYLNQVKNDQTENIDQEPPLIPIGAKEEEIAQRLRKWAEERGFEIRNSG